jgi:hypothetical protein
MVSEYLCGECGNSFMSEAAVKEHRKFAHNRRIEQIDHDDGGAAFGMSLRDYFAANAMQGFIAGRCAASKPQETASICDAAAPFAYIVADAMLKARKA